MTDSPLRDKNYDLFSVIYHASQGLHISRRYLQDATSGGDKEVADYFEALSANYAELVDKGKTLLKNRL